MKDAMPDGAPRYDVWIHLTGGMDQARDEMGALEPELRVLLEIVGDYVFQARTRLSVPAAQEEIVRKLIPVLDNPWVKQAIDLRLAEDLVDRGVGGFHRYRGLIAILLQSTPSALQSSYLRKASLAYVYGLYPSCTAFCGASLEAVLREWLTSHGYEVGQKATAGALLDRLALAIGKEEALISHAKELVSLRNAAIHGRLQEGDELGEAALRAIELLTQVLAEVDTHPYPDNEPGRDDRAR